MGAVGHHGYLGPHHIGPDGTPHAAVTSATAVTGANSTSLAPAIEFDRGYHQQHLDTLRLLPQGGWQAINPARGSLHAAKPFASVQAPPAAIADLVDTLTMVVVVCIASGIWIARYLVRLVAAPGPAP